MKYRGKEIGHPTIELVKDFCLKHKVDVDPIQLFIECEQAGWMTKQGKKARCLDAYLACRKTFYVEHRKVTQEEKRMKKFKKEMAKLEKSSRNTAPSVVNESVKAQRKKVEKKKEKKPNKPLNSNTYSKLLQDPRWQKRRLEIYTRDNWTCQMCGNGLYDGVPLNVHHHVYHIGYLPWEYKDNELITLCEKCHSKLHNK